MQRVILGAVAGIWFSFTAATVLPAQKAKPDGAKPIEGTLTIGKQVYKLTYAVAYETKRDDKTYISVLASDRKIPFDQIQTSMKRNKGSDDEVSLNQPFVLIMFQKTGEAVRCRASDEGSGISRSGGLSDCKLKFEDGRASGEAKLAPGNDAAVNAAFDFHWDLALDTPATSKPPKPAGPVKPSVSGTFNGNGKQAKLAFVSARPGEPFDGKSSILLVFTEQDHSKDPKPDFKAGFGDYGSALVISVFEDGRIFSCQVAHAAHGRMPFSSSGSVRTAAFELEEGRVEGEFKTDGEQKFFEKTWEVDLKFVAPYKAAVPKQVAAAKEKAKAAEKNPTKPTKDKPAKKDGNEDDEEGKPAKAGDALNVKALAIPKDATDIVYKKIVEQMTFKSATGHQALAAEFSKLLAAQGWKSDGDDLVAAKSAILKRTRGTANLTIFVKPADKGSTVTIMTEGLDWGEK